MAVAELNSGVIGSFFRDTGQWLRAVFRNRNLRRLQLAFCGSLIGGWAFSTAVAVWAYGVGGSKALGIYVASKFILMAITSPFAATFADKYSRRGVMIGSDVFSLTTVTAAAVCLYADTPAWPVFVLALLTSCGQSPFRSAQAALTPALARSPDELTASNGTSSTLESLAIFAGPAIAAVMLGFASIPVVFLLNSASFLWSILMVSGIRVPGAGAEMTADSATETPEVQDPGEMQEHEEQESLVAELLAGFRAIWRDKNLLLVVAEGAGQTLVFGASTVFAVVMAVDLLDLGARGVGLLNAAGGAGAIVGGVYAISRASKHKLAEDMTVGVLLNSLPVLLVTVWPSPITAFAVMTLFGLGNPLVDVNMFTIVQRITPDRVLARVFGALQACLIATMAIGAAVTPLLLNATGLRATVTILGLSVACLALLGLPRMRHLDRHLEAPEGLPLLQAIPMFTPLNPVVKEALARALVPVDYAAGDVIMQEGDESDRFFIIESGMVEVTASDGHVLRHERAGDYFGEIGLLRDVPRTATITALEDTHVLALDRGEFLGAVTGQGDARRLAEDVVSHRLMAS